MLDSQKGEKIFHSEADLKEKIGVQRRVLRSRSVFLTGSGYFFSPAPTPAATPAPAPIKSSL